jgi:hypothetical protein
MPLVAPVMTATLPLSRPMPFSPFCAMPVSIYSRLADATQAMLAALDGVFSSGFGLISDLLIG